MLEWLKRHAWKACIRQKRIPSSNLGHSAKKDDKLSSFFVYQGFADCQKVYFRPRTVTDWLKSSMIWKRSSLKK